MGPVTQTTERIRHIEMTWRCSACDDKNLGRHKICQTCGHPKDGSEHYEMPEDPSRAVTVTDEDLLRMATAGPDWRCAYCGSDQRRDNGDCDNCGASALEGGDASDGEPAPPPVPVPVAAPPRRRGNRKVVVGAGVLAAVAAGFVWNDRRPRDYEARVASVAWEHVIEVERYAVREKEGFRENIPKDAFETKGIGKRVHHHEQVLDGYDTQRYSVEVPDGTRTESYTARVACGEDCTETPRTCREKCTSNQNGFATCREVCSGGGRRCKTRYCSEARTRQVPKTRTEWRTRQVPRYRQEPRHAEAFRWKVWEWAPERQVRAEGVEAAGLRWPDGGARASGLPKGEQERERRRARYTVTLRYDDDDDVTFQVATPEELARFAVGTTHPLHREAGKMTVHGAPIVPLAGP